MALLNKRSLNQIRESVDLALCQAATVTLPLFRQPIDIDNKLSDGFDPVTEADRQAEQVLRNALSAALPQAQFLGEENSQPPQNLDPSSAIDLPAEIQQQLTWVVDPIDGTRAFITGLPLWGTLVALNDGDTVVFGALDQPWLGERFLGFEGEAFRLTKDGESKLVSRPPRPLHECIVQTTTPDMFATDDTLAGFHKVRDSVSMMRYGGDCYAYALVAMGGIDAVLESSLQPYDIQALIPIIEGAGGVVTNWEGEPCLDGGSVLASANASVHEALLKVLQN